MFRHLNTLLNNSSLVKENKMKIRKYLNRILTGIMLKRGATKELLREKDLILNIYMKKIRNNNNLQAKNLTYIDRKRTKV